VRSEKRKKGNVGREKHEKGEVRSEKGRIGKIWIHSFVFHASPISLLTSHFSTEES